MPFPENVKAKGVGPGVVLDKERVNASFPVEELSEVIWGGKANLAERRRLKALVHKDPVFGKRDKYFLSRDEIYIRGLKATQKLLELVQKNNLTRTQFDVVYEELDMLAPINLHLSMFLDAMRQQLTEDQKKKWLPGATNMTIVGTYAQTELGHGSFIRGLETTATFDEKSDEFVIHSPTLTSTKWWPGNLGKTSNHCIVMAQLIIKGKNYGLQGFIVPIRDIKTHKPLPGVTVGDIGPKFGYEMIDNGFLRFNQVRIPRDNMMMRYNSVDRNGKFTASKHSKILYATMVYTRVGIVGGCGIFLARAATIAGRYSAVRKQFPPAEGAKDEVPVIEYQTQQQKIIPNLAGAYTIFFSYLWLKQMYDKNTAAVNKGDFSLMAELHSVAACLKSLASEICVEGMEVCRKSCGGHGYMKLTGIIDAYQDIVPAQTYEGENTVMYLQTARYLMKFAGAALAGKKPESVAPTVAYLFDAASSSERCPATTANCFGKVNNALHALRALATGVILSTSKSIAAKVKSGMSQTKAWDSSLINLVRAANAHANYLLAFSFAEVVKSKKCSPRVRRVLELLITVFAGSRIEKFSGDLQESGYMSGKQAQLVREYNQVVLGVLRKDIVALGDAFDFSDYLLNSALGRYDGNVYEDMYNWAQGSRLNVIPVDQEVRKYLKPLPKAANL